MCVCNKNPKAAEKWGGVRVPTSSWRNFGPLDFFLRARMDDSSLFANDTLAHSPLRSLFASGPSDDDDDQAPFPLVSPLR